jgi:hypothetical protein
MARRIRTQCSHTSASANAARMHQATPASCSMTASGRWRHRQAERPNTAVQRAAGVQRMSVTHAARTHARTHARAICITSATRCLCASAFEQLKSMQVRGKGHNRPASPPSPASFRRSNGDVAAEAASRVTGGNPRSLNHLLNFRFLRTHPPASTAAVLSRLDVRGTLAGAAALHWCEQSSQNVLRPPVSPPPEYYQWPRP